jgi:PadR family transcriptional regulator PadR
LPTDRLVAPPSRLSRPLRDGPSPGKLAKLIRPPQTLTAMTRDRLGAFEEQVLLGLLRLGGSAYSAPLVAEMEDRLEETVAPAAVYIALRRLERRGLVQSSKSEPSPGEGGRGRRTFQVMPVAVEKVQEARRTYERFWDGLDVTAGEA